MLAAEAWLEAGDARRAMPYARDLVDAPGVDEGLLLRAKRLLARAVGAAPETHKTHVRQHAGRADASEPAAMPSPAAVDASDVGARPEHASSRSRRHGVASRPSGRPSQPPSERPPSVRPPPSSPPAARRADPPPALPSSPPPPSRQPPNPRRNRTHGARPRARPCDAASAAPAPSSARSATDADPHGARRKHRPLRSACATPLRAGTVDALGASAIALGPSRGSAARAERRSHAQRTAAAARARSVGRRCRGFVHVRPAGPGAGAEPPPPPPSLSSAHSHDDTVRPSLMPRRRSMGVVQMESRAPPGVRSSRRAGRRCPAGPTRVCAAEPARAREQQGDAQGQGARGGSPSGARGPRSGLCAR